VHAPIRPDDRTLATGEPDRGRGLGARLAKLAPRILLVALLVLAGIWVVERTSWYLAIDQFGYLTFARDLAAGRVFHESPIAALLDDLLPPGVESDLLAQTYVRRDGLLYCRYSPGFPLLLAAAVPFGETAVRSLNVGALLALLTCLYGLGRRLLGSEWQGLAAALLACLLPTYLLLWSISPLRDVPTHLFALAGLGTLIGGRRPLSPRRAAVAGALLGFAVSIRVDASLYLIAAASLAWRERPWPAKRFAGALAGLLIGAAPILAYNWVATGNPLLPTQFMEARQILSRGEAGSPSWQEWLPPWSESALAAPSGPEVEAGTRARLLQGGGLKLRHLGTILPANFAILRGIFGDLGLALVAVGAIASLRRPELFAFTVPYAVIATLFFSLWTRAEPRYLAGVVLMSVLLLVDGCAALAAAPTRRTAKGIAVALAVGVAVFVLAGWTPQTSQNALPMVTGVLRWSTVAALTAAVVLGRVPAERTMTVALALGLMAALVWRSTDTLGFRARFQRAEAERARSVVAEVFGPNAIVITRSDIGRPAENINYYTDVSAVYEQELQRAGVDPLGFVNDALRRGFTAYLLMPPHDVDRWRANRRFRTWFDPELVARIPAQRAAEYFVASPQHRGTPLDLFRIHLKHADTG
jgi:hypothetical protein